ITVYLGKLLPAYFASKQVDEMSLCQLKWHLYQDFEATMAKIQLNLDRLKASAPVGKDYIWINIPACELIVFDSEFPVQRHFVVVGAPHTPTPVISGPMAEVISFPRWNIPKSIVINEITPAMRRNSDYLAKKGYELVDWYGNYLDPEDIDWDEITKDYVPFRVIQEPGYMNALGVMKFNFINRYRIYLHDTNAKSYFKRKNRALSHGCIRVENPLELAKYLLSEYSYKSFRKHLAEKATRHYRVNKELQVYIRYLTCTVNADGELVFYEDIYGKDQADLKELWASLPKW
ncbi:MAG: L,D-transpeptidase family protein, partial [Marinilabiliaceae bacterium]|nr:L,D-transpeptidase family protein [Marinilabiliaceae bacterium]